MTPIPLLSVALVIGIALATFLSLERPTAQVVASCFVVVHLCATFCLRRRTIVPAFAAVLASLGVGLAIGAVEPWSVPAFKSCEHLLFGEVERPIRGAQGRWFLALKLQGAAVVSKEGSPLPLNPATGDLLLAIDERSALRVRLREEILLRASGLNRHQRRNFGDGRREASTFGSIVAGPLSVGGHSDGLFSALAEVRIFVRNSLRQVIDGPELGVVLAMVLGDRTHLDPELVTSFRRTGTSHLLAVSGLHVTLVSLLARWLLLSVLVRTPLVRRYHVAAPASALAAVVCWFYAILTGLAPPAFRAAIMTSAALSATIAGRPSSSVRAICVAAVTLLTIDPSLLGRPGFQLSFAAVLALNGLGLRAKSGEESTPSPVLAPFVELWAAMVRTMRSSSAATLATAPIVAHYFGLFSPLGVLVNSVAVPFMGVLLPAMILLAMVSAVSVTAGRILAWAVVEGGLALFLGGLRWVNSFQSACVAVSRPALHEALLLACAGGLVMRSSRISRVVAVLLTVVSVTSWSLRLHLDRFDRTLNVTFLDMGSGDATLIDLPEGGRMLVDAGPYEGSDGTSTDVVASLQRTGYGPLDLLALTHGHSDHVAGAEAVLRDIGAERYWSPRPGWADDDESREIKSTIQGIERLARARGAAIERPPAICGIHRLGGVRIEVLHPCDNEARSLGENDRSLVLRILYGRFAVLLPGDVEGPAEEMLLRRRHQLKATVLKLPHHGSDTSSRPALLDAVDPTIAVASCGRSRRGILPHPDVVLRLLRRDTLVLSTAELGAIGIETDGHRLSLSSARLGTLHLR